jgi:uncharacterized DUF497 family protein
MEFEWDEEKRLKNIDKQGIDFNAARLLFDGLYLVGSGKATNGEERWLAIGVIDEVYITAVFTRRGSVIRIISMRRARDGERQKYQEVFGS